MREYEDSVKAYRDIVNAVNTARKEGREEGLEKGHEEEKIEILNRSYSKKAKAVVQYTLEGRFVRVFKSIA